MTTRGGDLPSGLVAQVIRVAKGLAGFVVVAGLWEVARAAGVLKPSAAPSAGAFVSAVGTALHTGALPAVAGSTPARIFTSVDLPAPFWPRIASVWPG